MLHTVNEFVHRAADLSRTFGFDLPAIVTEQNHSPDLGDCCARSIVSRAAGTIRYNRKTPRYGGASPATGSISLLLDCGRYISLSACFTARCESAAPLRPSLVVRRAMLRRCWRTSQQGGGLFLALPAFLTRTLAAFRSARSGECPFYRHSVHRPRRMRFSDHSEYSDYLPVHRQSSFLLAQTRRYG